MTTGFRLGPDGNRQHEEQQLRPSASYLGTVFISGSGLRRGAASSGAFLTQGRQFAEAGNPVTVHPKNPTNDLQSDLRLPPGTPKPSFGLQSLKNPLTTDGIIGSVLCQVSDVSWPMNNHAVVAGCGGEVSV